MSTKYIKDYMHLSKYINEETVFVAFDTETTGLKAAEEYIMEIGAVKFTLKDCQPTFDELINIPVTPSAFIQELTHITPDMLEDKDTEDKVLERFFDYIQDKNAILIAHNAAFDVGFLNAALNRVKPGKELEYHVIDTLALSRWAFPLEKGESAKGKYTLQTLASRFGIKVKNAHRADDDARVCMELFKIILKTKFPLLFK